MSNETSSDAIVESTASAEVERLREALASANIPTLLMVLVQLTGEKCWLAAPFAPSHAQGLDDNDDGGLALEVQQQIREATLKAVLAYRAGELEPIEPEPAEVARMLSVALAEEVPLEYGPLLAEELGTKSRDVELTAPVPDGFEVVIIGAGLSGICAAINLRRAGVPFTILEKNAGVGGTWLENRYPGVGVDTPSHLYSFSFAKNTKWSRYFAKGNEVFDYLESLVDQHDIRRDIRFETEVERAEFDEDEAQWLIRTTHAGDRDTVRATVLISAVGMVNRPSIPDIPGIDDFAGPVMHTAAWDTRTSVNGRRVAVIGTGASAMQLVPSIVDDAEHVTIFQRSKQWALPHPNYHRDVSPEVRLLMDEIPFYIGWYRLRSFWNFSDRLHATIQVDPAWPHSDRSVNASNERHRKFLTRYITEQLEGRDDLIEACVPDYPPYGKRPLIDNGWFKMLLRDDVELVDDGVASIGTNDITSTAGRRYPADVLVMATGFKTLQMLYPMDIRGRGGKALRGQMWDADDARAYLGITVPDYPNFFILNGPNTNAGHGGSAIHSTEFQVRYLLQALNYMFTQRVRTLEPARSSYDEYNRELDAALALTVWAHPGMTTYYRNAAGRIVITSPWKYLEYWSRTLEFDPTKFKVEFDAEGEVASSGSSRSVR
ncbi:flavin-containing monooxygenase [Mycobacterium sherrisii]|uniref:flavin-containing monooxygenase n=1 Tax=Mycobacterium sherrisii TaxID=243061 RepID=UPI000A23F76D|nr:NAD(P)/FAD-dependent oxidoreductase [Mycobacterium sherrisii]ORW74181.1 monooxygenase [Mycobacterium sherrisii]